ncbi:transcription antitermination factor NusB [Bacillus suaedaesalsae]|uniref:Transcription antitermination protein NusB n=1 Tax=Bacillus suaedaesalsae TaxID=2810349 RepID=A0ABS2DH32_9BACI|nr:transcription antitermination factor NusB [Bacillus suaedaesalsae]MBM6617340.1 transcription antitermination factor NusB [Bacillus suaedaesalsae]
MKRRTAREKALQALFQLDLNEQEPTVAIEHVLEGKGSDEFLEKLVLGATEHQQEIDELLKGSLENWSLDRIGNVDRAILRLAVYEMKFEESIPENVSINEAIELAKIFGDDDSSKFINSVLSKVKGQLA